MITRVRLSNWKVYENFDLELTPGTTFLVAGNGIGKSSFVEAVRWALDPDAKSARSLMRRLSQSTTVTVGLRVGETDVSVTRTLTHGQSATPSMSGSATVGADEMTVSDALNWVAAAWRADAALPSPVCVPYRPAPTGVR